MARITKAMVEDVLSSLNTILPANTELQLEHRNDYYCLFPVKNGEVSYSIATGTKKYLFQVINAMIEGISLYVD